MTQRTPASTRTRNYRTTSFGDGSVRFAADLRGNIAAGDANYLSLLDEADAYITLNGLDLPKSRRPACSAPTRAA